MTPNEIRNTIRQLTPKQHATLLDGLGVAYNCSSTSRLVRGGNGFSHAHGYAMTRDNGGTYGNNTHDDREVDVTSTFHRHTPCRHQLKGASPDVNTLFQRNEVERAAVVGCSLRNNSHIREALLPNSNVVPATLHT
eukprot:c44259_g1_i1 orf=64-471(-)